MVTTGTNSASEAVARITESAQTRLEGNLHKLEFRAMSTPCRVNFHGVTAADAKEIQQDVVQWVAQFEARYSRFIPDSLISRINAAAGDHWVEIDPQTELILNLCQELYFFTRGAFDPTALPLIRLWNWKENPPVLPAADDLVAARELVGWNKVQRRPGEIFLPVKGMCLDLGGIGKEYAVDCVMNMIVRRGVHHVLVDFGQDVRVLGHAPEKAHWLIGLEDAALPGKCWAGVAVTNHAVATSGDYMRFFRINGRRYGHIIDPRTGYPALNDVRAASIIAPSCTIAGLLATSACILGAKEALDLIEMHPGAAGAITTETTKLYSRKFHEYIPA